MRSPNNAFEELVKKWRAKSVSARHIQQSVLRNCAAELETVLKNKNGIPNPAAAQELLDALLKATRELNEIRARDGVPYTHNHVPASVDADYFSSVVDECFAAIDKATTPTS